MTRSSFSPLPNAFWRKSSFAEMMVIMSLEHGSKRLWNVASPMYHQATRASSNKAAKKAKNILKMQHLPDMEANISLIFYCFELSKSLWPSCFILHQAFIDIMPRSRVKLVKSGNVWRLVMLVRTILPSQGRFIYEMLGILSIFSSANDKYHFRYT